MLDRGYKARRLADIAEYSVQRLGHHLTTKGRLWPILLQESLKRKWKGDSVVLMRIRGGRDDGSGKAFKPPRPSPASR